MITVVNYGIGNLGSIQNMLKRIGVSSIVTNDLEDISKARKLLLPGVGSFDNAMARIDSRGFRRILDHKALKERIPILGICLGMQIMTRSSDEGKLSGLAWVPASTIRFPAQPGTKVPHMGWNRVIPTRDSPLTKDLPDESRFYFVHSYYVRVDSEEDSILKTDYGIRFDAAIQRGNIFGAQFHPEKSHKFGMRLLMNFARL
ncbi:MAG: imidazole glycerol phosphate synthase subunit HisH [Elusimicrobia bacterium]|nr:imidazole glycerol phosphate synthase subunit HisH [Elusimicrobiota bacterium]